MDKVYDAKAVETATLAALKDFQLETVKRVDALFRSGQRRVLVADEVGLGKTVVARGVIAKTATLRREEHDDLFKVAYICSNQNIANQNVQKLRVSDEVQLDEDVIFVKGVRGSIFLQAVPMALPGRSQLHAKRGLFLLPGSKQIKDFLRHGYRTDTGFRFRPLDIRFFPGHGRFVR